MTAVAVHPDNRLIAIGSYKSIQLFDGNRYRPLFTIGRPEATPRRLVFSHDGSQLFAAYEDGTVRAWSTRSLFPAEAQEMVARLAAKFPLMIDVTMQLMAAQRVDARTRAIALRIAGLRPEAVWAMHQYVIDPLLSPSAGRTAYAPSYRRAEEMHRLEPTSPASQFFCGLAQYRLGYYKPALATVEALSTVKELYKTHHPAVRPIRAIPASLSRSLRSRCSAERNGARAGI